ncbi:hypothetical protein [Clostridium saccharobutylicum]|uniref:Uncharacterized protein n=1 Tax=Clostridium saccharobutylicum DSM 13864 TaxID=1345695 RepID=U5MV52_CLOSA|nr:hypothetical protein [Clostridium saccharobutylicum]AGX44455.1 hypothetical protein CLSA_c34940 [Clostridium saccharobutylicum DSM 13864]MBA8983842.1 hypothetical protein [Clostridium saccharobutylicum]NOW18934.1 hypothetical protein [Clostridium saccharobutylicum]NOW49940.1 hypothetical protein [Clostridium saccharobutylicum]NOW63982.1 hypothetical protein [Clostridium saccharobutylicum]
MKNNKINRKRNYEHGAAIFYLKYCTLCRFDALFSIICFLKIE